jgi:hypothetical protein
MEDATATARFGNVGTLLSVPVGAKDAEVLTEQFRGDLTPSDLMALPHHKALWQNRLPHSGNDVE